jgi:PAS domain-containing protein
MKAREALRQTMLTEAEMVDASNKLGLMPGEKQNVSQQDLRQELQESRNSEARLRKIIDTIPTLAWCNLTDGSNDFVNRRWSDYTGLSQEEVKLALRKAFQPNTQNVPSNTKAKPSTT